MMKRLVLILTVCAVLFVFSASAKAETFTVYLSAAQEVPATASTATGYATIVLDESAGTIAFTVVFSGLTSAQNNAHIHAPAPIGTNAGVAIDLGVIGGTAGTITGTAPITPTQIAHLRSHQAYINVHSVNFPAGEIRGQIGGRRHVDYDGDGRTDFSVLRFPNIPQPGVSPITYWNSNSTDGVQTTLWGDANRDFPAPGDFDGDAKDDLSIYRDGTTADPQSVFAIFRSSDNTAFITSFGTNGDQAITRDYDGDGITDVAVYRRGVAAADNAVWYIRQSTTGNTIVIPFGLSGNGTTSLDSAVPGDYDGDGKFDVAVYRFGAAPANTFIIRRSSDGAVQFQQWGNFNSDYILPGDYDGDGKTDFCAGRTGATGNSPLVWWILQSSNGQVVARPFGLTSDRPVQGDYDGDARTDIAVYRTVSTPGASNMFFVANSLSNTVTFFPWGATSDFPVATFDAR